MQNLQPAFKALADPTRREILSLLASKDLTIAELADNFAMTRAAVKKHLNVLQDGGLISSHADGRARINQINGKGIAPVIDWLGSIDAFWDTRLDALKSAIEKDLH